MVIDASIIQAPIDWSQVKRFTPSLYKRYSEAKIYELDGFGSWGSYNAYWAQLAQTLMQSSKAKIGPWQLCGLQAAKSVETNQSASIPIFDMDGALASEPLPIALAMIQEKVARLATNPAYPQIERQQEEQQQQVAALNALMNMVLAGNNYETTTARGHYDVQFWNAAIFRWNLDPFQPGLFGEPGKLTLEKCAIDDIFWDPACKLLDCDSMDYVIQRHSMEIGEIQAQYPLSAAIVPPEATDMISDTSATARNNDDYIQSPQPKLARDTSAGRQKITVLELWIKDSQMKFEPMVLDSTSPYYENRYQTDRDGYIIGKWVKRYPTGRQVVTTSASVLKDLANPYPHGQFPFIFAQGMPSSTTCAPGNAMRILVVTRKMNAIIRDLMAYFQSEIKRPMYATPGAILNPEMAQNVPNDPTYVLEIERNGRLERRPAVDVPGSVYTLLQMLQQFLDMVSGSGGLMRGILEESDQLSVQAMAQAEQYESSRLALEAKFFRVASVQIFYQLMWFVRALVRSKIKLQLKLPTGEQMTVDWKSDREVFERGDPTEIQNLRAREDYTVGIRAGTGAPGAQAQQHAAFSQLYKEGAIDRQAYLEGIQFPGRDDIVKRMRNQELEDINAKAQGRAMGLTIGDTLRKADSPTPGSKGKV